MQTLDGGPWTLVDLVLLTGLLLSTLVGMWRGLVREVMALLGWVAAFVAARWWGPALAPTLSVGEPGSRVNLLAGMMLVFVLAWLAWAVLSWALRQVVDAAGLSAVDRAMGSVFGLARGVVVALLLFTLVSLTPLADWEPWRASQVMPWLRVAAEGLRPVLPVEVVRFLPPVAPE